MPDALCPPSEHLPSSDKLSDPRFRFDLEEPWVRWHVEMFLALTLRSCAASREPGSLEPL